MLGTTISALKSFTAKRKGLLSALVKFTVKPALRYAEIDPASADLYGEMIGCCVDTALDLVEPSAPKANLFQVAEFRPLLEQIAATHKGLLDRLEQQVPDQTAVALVYEKLVEVQTRDDGLKQAVAGVTAQIREQVLSLTSVENRLDEIANGIKKLGIAYEDYKQYLIGSPMWSDWDQFRQSDPDAVALLNAADQHFLQGEREEGIKLLVQMFRRRGVGHHTIAVHLGLMHLADGNAHEAREIFDAESDPASPPPPDHLLPTIAYLTTSPGKTELPPWRKLPRGFPIGRSFIVEIECGRGGMASVYKVKGVDKVYGRYSNTGVEKFYALKVPAPGLVATDDLIERFIDEIEISKRLMDKRPTGANVGLLPKHIVRTLTHAIFVDPSTDQETYALIQEFIHGENLARYLQRRKHARHPLTDEEIRDVFKAVCPALEFAHAEPDPILHRDVNPKNILRATDGTYKLTDFGIGRMLADAAHQVTKSAHLIGTLPYMPPESLLRGGLVDVRSDVYQLGVLLLELMTFSPNGSMKVNPEYPAGWIKLIADATNRDPETRPANVREFLERLDQANRGHGKWPPPPPGSGIIIVP